MNKIADKIKKPFSLEEMIGPPEEGDVTESEVKKKKNKKQPDEDLSVEIAVPMG